MTDWQPIDTCPEDKPVMLLMAAKGYRDPRVIGMLQKEEFEDGEVEEIWEAQWSTEDWTRADFTHWAELPELPSIKE